MDRASRTCVHSSRRGSVYVIVLLTVLSVVVLVLSGAALRRETLDVSHAHADAARAATLADAGARFAEHVMLDSDLVDSVLDDDEVLAESTGNTTLSVTIEEPETSAPAAGEDSHVRVVSRARVGETQRTMSFEVMLDSEYQRLGQELGAVSYWPLNEGKGSSVFRDRISGRESAFKSAGQAGKETHDDTDLAPRFNNENQILEVEHRDVYETEDLTIALWVRWDAAGDEVQGVIAKESPMDYSPPQHAMYFYRGDLYYQVEVGGSTRYVDVPSGYFEDEQWHFVAVTVGYYTGLQVYVDGKRVVDTATIWIGLKWGSWVNELPWTIGGRRDDASKSGYLDDNLDGSVARIMILPSALGASEVRSLFEAQTLATERSIVAGSYRIGS